MSAENDDNPNWKNLTIEKMSVFQNKEYEYAYVSYVENPSSIFIQLEQTRKNFEEMEDELNEIYPTKIWKPIQWTIGKFCVVKKDDDFYRAKIIDTSTDEFNSTFYDVFYVDYGDCEQVPETRIYLLTPQIASLPSQAIPCSLKNALPKGRSWKQVPKSIEFFKQLVLDKFVDVKFHARPLNSQWPLPLVDLKLFSDKSNVFEQFEAGNFCVRGSDEEIFQLLHSQLTLVDYRIYSIPTEDDDDNDDNDDEEL